MFDFDNLRPVNVWSFFYEICQVPRPSKKEGKIINYLMDFGKKHQLNTKRDEAGNVLITKPATSNYKNVSTVVLQSHVDMVCEKNASTKHNFDEDPIIPYADDDWVTAKGTTLGADDGIGIAAQLALLASNEIEHGPIECLFTVDEETGLTGANELKPFFFTGKTLINLDSEDEGEIFIGCAGGIDTVAKFPLQFEPVPRNGFAFKIEISGLTGGHSGDDIHFGRANANKILTQFLLHFLELFDVHIAHMNGGNLRNAIAREASAICVIHSSHKEKLRVEFNILSHEIEQEFIGTDPEMLMKLQTTDLPKQVMCLDIQRKILLALDLCPHGIISMSEKLAGMVQTSTNLASIKLNDDVITVVSSHRSSDNKEKSEIANKFKQIFEKEGASVVLTNGYPGWEANRNSKILSVAENKYQELFNEKPKVRVIHAGLECGLFLEKYPDLDMISIGPTIKGAHSPDEKINIITVQKFWKYLIEILQNV